MALFAATTSSWSSVVGEREGLESAAGEEEESDGELEAMQLVYLNCIERYSASIVLICAINAGTDLTSGLWNRSKAARIALK